MAPFFLTPVNNHILGAIPMMSFSIAGGVSMGAAQLNESQLDRIIGFIRTSVKKIWRSTVHTLNQGGAL
ncbi:MULTISPECIES: protease FtsH-inhibitory lysogeny factor CIII [Pantoea]|uniref:protease FtsH-inhibitory lysogeny factor CIII n=1 Tax=Pantoea TaxID=53335 RepID=UPI0025961C63|nr:MULTISPECIES: protease FtsH-inhibitory lysogeny factor CIII [Pantoea]